MTIYRALDWGLDDSEERELGPQLERLIERMVGADQGGEGDSTTGSGTTDEGYSGQEEEEEEEEDDEEEEEEDQEGALRPVCTFRQVMALCASRLADPSLAAEHYQAVCRALFVETLELQTFLIKIRDAKEVSQLFISTLSFPSFLIQGSFGQSRKRGLMMQWSPLSITPPLTQ